MYFHFSKEVKEQKLRLQWILNTSAQVLNTSNPFITIITTIVNATLVSHLSSLYHLNVKLHLGMQEIGLA